MKVELHCHTNLSDGSFTFDEIIQLALRENVSHLAITNHDTTKDLENMVITGGKSGVEIIPGIEISAYDFKRNTRVHILGYYIDPGNPTIEAICGPILERRHQGCLTMVHKLIEAGYSITLEDVEKFAVGGTGIYKQHIMHALIEQGYTTTIYGDLYKKLFSRGQNGENPGIAYIPMEYVEAKAAIHAVLQAGGVPVLAHPGQYGNFEAVPELVESGLQGIEVWHPLHEPKDEAIAQEYALKYDLLMTGGSDFHGFYGEKEVELGSKSLGLEIVKAIKARKEAIVGN
ncbi:PHP domain-containing protein [Paenibacillus radicis (ex Xue et al. 2023)]|uniref:PHP domain-containing protein n=1 Tax=Paenibacillus radicis (ex Xue et al. 2023) TaxID=2972489 RepID=A0ABT1YAS9_9BACL|nr:PHP domain-containing protein [Paenibacillus radicis (ex Xue et al. 2023)]MCR8630291.1 PHP domain-containing protein [Paenibacillus radicis (ex Xue et al. 2023)]